MKRFFILTLIIIIFLVGCLQLETQKERNVVEITDSGFVPNTLKIKAGEKVIFVNKNVNPHWPASANHPTHTVYPEEGGCLGSKFDSCVGLKTGEIFSFKFEHNGIWEYHDHLNSAMSGTIVVE